MSATAVAAGLPVAMRAALLVLGAFALNLPFGAWRVSSRRFSPSWLLSIHVPIPLLFLMRRGIGLTWPWIGLSLLGAASAQFLGGRFWERRRARP